jgi:hypothetical protein
MKALPKVLLALTAIAVVSIAYPTPVQAVPTTYQYTGNPFTVATGPYTTSDFVTAMVTLSRPLPANMPFTSVTPTAFTFFDGVQTISNTTPNVDVFFVFATNARGEITLWFAQALANDPDFRFIDTIHDETGFTADGGGSDVPGSGGNEDSPGVWSVNASVPDAGSTLSLMTLTLMALGLVARRFQRAAA